jgi:aspartokinase/homoserine dehydrogenase 1
MTVTSSFDIEQSEGRRSRASRPALAVYKFGGAALADGPAVKRAAALIAERVGAPTLVVVSALAGVTDSLIAIAHRAADGANVREDIAHLRHRHLALVDDAARGRDVTVLHDAVLDSFSELQAIADALGVSRQLCPRTLDRVAARGENLAARILTAALSSTRLSAKVIDVTDLLYTNGHHGCATPDLARVRTAAAEIIKPLLARCIVPVVPGFVGRGADGDVVTLGRGGSDLTATVLARVLDARQTVLWKDVPGILTADPRAVPAARLVPQVTAGEAAALALHGAKVLHPRALVPLTTRTRLWIRPFEERAGPGTSITARGAASRAPVKAIAASTDQALVTISARGFLPLVTLGARAYAALESVGLGSSLAGQTSSAHAISFTLRNEDAPFAADALRRAFAAELASAEIDKVSVRDRVATIAVIGTGLATRPELVTRVFDALAVAGIEIIASMHRPADVAMSVVIDEARAADAQRALHDALQLDKTGGGRVVSNGQIDVVLLGVGAIARELLAQVAATRSPLRVCGLIDTSGYVFDPRGFSRARLAGFVAIKTARRPLASLAGARRGGALDALAEICDHALTRPVLVDATAADTSAILETMLRRGWNLVLANKLPLAGDQALFDRLRCKADGRARQVLHEATVGAGLPVIDTLRKLQEAGDRVLRIEGCPSGTLGFLFGELGRGRTFSAALRSAVAAGYTEPDPRIDLSGADVARKALILARLIGFRGSLADVSVESLIPAALRDVPLPDFLARLPELDESWKSRIDAAGERGRVLRYRARVTRRSIEVGLTAVAATDSLGALDGTDNQFAFTTMRYRKQPLVITGPGAGPAVTAAGVYNDLLRLAEWGSR